MMFSRRGWIILSAFAALCGMAYGQSRPEPNAFLNRKVTSTAALVEQVRNDPEVRDRYMRHFAMDQEELITYLQSLHPAKLNQGGLYKIYSVPEDRVIKVRVDQLKAGELVFADASGRPVLLLRCGNPLTMGPARPMMANEVGPDLEESATTELSEIEVPPEEAGIAEVNYVTPVAPGVPVFTETGGTETALFPPTGGGGGTGALGLLAGLPLLFALGGGGGGGVIPEPASMIVLGTGFIALYARRRRQK